ncbi:rhamnogalacturonan acetylesterase [Persicobacter diffluens]|uniref:rhamnogalacturonan acetylesterase n=1 Tax=Persicobacter diffluens TaxID=981 RepID=UPI0030C65EF3
MIILSLVLVVGVGFVMKKNVKKIYILGDSTVANYALEEDYQKKRFPQMGWGQVFQDFMQSDSLRNVPFLSHQETVIVDDRAKGGRSTRTFFQEGRWRKVYDQLNKGDVVLMQFGHNDQSVQKVLRYVNVEGYKEFLRLYISQTLQKGAFPILITPVNRNYPWIDGKLVSCHGEYPNAVKSVAKEFGIPCIDLTNLSLAHFTDKGQEYVSSKYFMNLAADKFEAYPKGIEDNTHFQVEGAYAVAQLVFNEFKQIRMDTNKGILLY